MADNSDILGTYKDLPVTETKIVVNKLGDGLSDAVGIDPIVIEAGEVAFLAVRVRKTKDRYDITYNADGIPVGAVLVQVFDSTGATFADHKIIAAAVQKTVDRVEKAKAEAKGQLTLVLGEKEDDDGPTRKKHPNLASKVDDAFGE